MSDGRFAILDPAAGISGDMVLGALIGLGAPREWLKKLPSRLGLDSVDIDIETVVRCGLEACKVNVRLPGGKTEGPGDFVSSEPLPLDHHHPHDHPHLPHRHLADLIAVLQRAELSDWVRGQAMLAFRLLAEAEGAVHGIAAERVALHEVGAVDALVDVVGAIEGFERLGIERIYHRPVALGHGWIRAEHGVLPVPAPVTMRLLEGIEIGPNGPVSGEATTPTGAVLLRVLSAGAPPGHWRPVASAWGAGGRDPREYPNALRLLLAEPAAEAAEVVTLATDLDDLSPEYLEPMREALVAAGALDVQLWTTQMKKGRTGFRLEVQAERARADRVTEALFLHSTTAGVRRWTAERVTLARRQVEVDAAAGMPIRVKLLDTPGGLRAKPEFDDIRAAATRLGRPAHELAREIQQRALVLFAAAGPGSMTSNEESG